MRLLRADEIECRIAMIKPSGISLLLYKDARVDQRILDEEVGMYNWQRHHRMIDGTCYCTVAIRDPETDEWVEKEDAGTPANMEKEKSMASDSFKRACFNWGIGRELYSAPFIWISSEQVKVENGKCFEKFKVASITYNSAREIVGLTIVNSKGDVVFQRDAPQVVTDAMITTIEKACEEKDIDISTIMDTYKVNSLADMTVTQFKNCMKRIEKSKGDK